MTQWVAGRLKIFFFIKTKKIQQAFFLQFSNCMMFFLQLYDSRVKKKKYLYNIIFFDIKKRQLVSLTHSLTLDRVAAGWRRDRSTYNNIITIILRKRKDSWVIRRLRRHQSWVEWVRESKKEEKVTNLKCVIMSLKGDSPMFICIRIGK